MSFYEADLLFLENVPVEFQDLLVASADASFAPIKIYIIAHTKQCYS